MMRLIHILLCAATVPLAGCVDRTAIAERMQTAIATCQGQQFKTQAALAACINAAEQRGAAEYGLGNNDLVSVRAATRSVLAERLDKGQITKAEAELEFAKANSGLISTDQNRAATASMANAMQRASRPKTCIASGNMVNCF